MLKADTHNSLQQYLVPEYLRSVQGLTLLAKMTVQSLLPGINPSQKNGIGQEFSQYRTYQTGDDIRLLDWKMYARSDRFYIKESEVDTNIQVRFIIDTSASMLHEDSGMRKLDFVRYTSATLAWLAQGQGDQIGLFAFNNTNKTELTPKMGRRFFSRWLYALSQIRAEGIFPNAVPIGFTANRKGSKELILFFTDFHESEHEILSALRQLKTKRNEIIVCQVLGQNEFSLPTKKRVATFKDLETGRLLQVDTKQFNKKYKQIILEQIEQYNNELLKIGIHHHVMNMSENLGETLKIFLKKRDKLL